MRILLGTQLRRLREETGISRETAGETIRSSHSKISRMELGRVSFKERDVTDLLDLYGVEDAHQREALLALVRQANTQGWWEKYDDIMPNWFELYVGMEQAAALIRTYEIQFVPGLLQTEEYARAVTLLGHPDGSADEIARRVSLRMGRQELLTSDEPPKIWAVVDEGALRRPLGGSRVMRGQLEHLIEITRLPNVTLQMLPFRFGGHAAAGGPFTVLRFSQFDLPDIVYLEHLTSAFYLDKRDETDLHMLVMDRLGIQAESPGRTISLLHDLISEY